MSEKDLKVLEEDYADPLPVEPPPFDPESSKELRATAGKLQRAAKAKDEAEKEAARQGKAIEKIIADVLPEVAKETPLAKVDKTIMSIVPEWDKIRVYYRNPDGKLVLINDYHRQEIGVDGDVVAFINKRLRESYGDLEYEVFYRNPKGQELHLTTVPRLTPKPASAPVGDTSDLLRDLVKRMISERDAAAKEIKPSPADELNKLMQVIQTQGKTDPMMLMTIPLMRDAMRSLNADSGQKADMQVMLQLIDRIDRLEKERSQPPPPFLPSPPDVNPMEIMRETIRELKDALRSEPRKDTLTDVILPMLSPLIQDAVRRMAEPKPRDDSMQRQLDQVVQELRELRHQPGAPARTIRDMMLEQIEVREAAAKLAPQPAPGPPVSEGFWNFLDNAFSNLPAVIAQAKQLVDAGAHGRQQPAAAQNSLVSTGFPTDTDRIMRVIEQATDDGQVIGAFMTFIQELAELTAWRSFVKSLALNAAEGRKRKVVKMVSNLAALLEKRQLLAEGGAGKIIDSLEIHIDDVVEAFATIAGQVGAVVPLRQHEEPRQVEAPPRKESDRQDEDEDGAEGDNGQDGSGSDDAGEGEP